MYLAFLGATYNQLYTKAPFGMPNWRKKSGPITLKFAIAVLLAKPAHSS